MGSQMTKVDQASRRPLLRVAFDLMFGARGRIGSTVYGTLIVLTALTAAYAAEKHHPWKLIELVATAVGVFWVAYVYADALSESIEGGTPLTRLTLSRIANRELGLLFAGVVPILALLLGAVGLISESVSIWVALGAGLTILSAEGVRYAHTAKIGRARTAAIVMVNLALGLCVIALKVAVVH